MGGLWTYFIFHVVSVIGIVTNTSLLYLIRRHTRVSLGAYKQLLTIFASFDLFLTVLHGLIEPVLSSYLVACQVRERIKWKFLAMSFLFHRHPIFLGYTQYRQYSIHPIFLFISQKGIIVNTTFGIASTIIEDRVWFRCFRYSKLLMMDKMVFNNSLAFK